MLGILVNLCKLFFLCAFMNKPWPIEYSTCHLNGRAVMFEISSSVVTKVLFRKSYFINIEYLVHFAL